jgi:CRP/FNR family transcriptional regulator, cyclic AMP receptor protein
MVSRSLPTFTRAALLDLQPLPTVEFRRAEVIFSPGDACDSVMYIQCGGVKVSIVSDSGREAVVGVLGPGDFLGEGCLAGEPTRMRSATAVTRSTLIVVARDEVMRLLRQAPISARLLAHVLARHATMEQALVNQLFSSTETRLARTLLLLARYGTHGRPQKVVRHVSRATLADMVGTTPARISALIRKFRRAGWIEYDDGIVVKRSLLRLMLQD